MMAQGQKIARGEPARAFTFHGREREVLSIGYAEQHFSLPAIWLTTYEVQNTESGPEVVELRTILGFFKGDLQATLTADFLSEMANEINRAIEVLKHGNPSEG